MVYLIHFNAPFKHANHYIGFTKGALSARIKKHSDGTGAKLLRAVNLAGIGWKVVRIWKDGDRTFERKLKNRKKSRCLCPICNKAQSKHLHKSIKTHAIS